MADGLSKEALTALVREVLYAELPAATEQLLGRPVADIIQQVDNNSTIAHDAAMSRMGALLGLKGKELQSAATKLLDYNNSLPPDQQFSDDDGIISAWEKLNPEAPPAATPVDTATADNKAPKMTEEGLPIYTQDKLNELLSQDAAAFFSNPDLVSAYAEGRVEVE